MALAARLSCFLQERGLGATELTPEVIEGFLSSLRAKGALLQPTLKTLAWLVGDSMEIGVMPTPTPCPPQSREEELVARTDATWWPSVASPR